VSQFSAWVDERLNKLDADRHFDGLVYHYTSVEGLNGILNSGGFRFTRLEHHKDPDEFKFGLSFVVPAIEAVAHRFNGVQKLAEVLPQAFEKWRKRSTYYTSSFSLAGNLSYQWDNYADNGKGVAVGFDPEIFIPKPSANPFDLPIVARQMVAKVHYGSEWIRAQQRSAIEKALTVFSAGVIKNVSDNRHQQWALFTDVAVALIPLLYANAISAKLLKFEDEREIRLAVAASHTETAAIRQSFDRDKKKIEYLLCPLNPHIHAHNTIREVRIGPKADATVAAHVRGLLEKFCNSPATIAIVPWT